MTAETSEDETDFQDIEYQQQREKRHKETIQILVASGIFGAYFALYPDDLPNGPFLSPTVNAVFVTNSIFLLYKLSVNSEIPLPGLGVSKRIDRVVPLLYLFSIWASAVIVGLVIVSREYGISLEDLEAYAGILLTIGVLLLVFAVSIIGLRRQKSDASDLRDNVRNQVPRILSHFEEGGLVNGNQRDSLEERFFSVLDSDDDVSIWGYAGGGLLGSLESEPLRLSGRELEIVLNLFRRIETRAEHEIYTEDDFEDFEKIVKLAENRTS